MATNPILLLGANGQVGSELVTALQGLGPVIALGRAHADLSEPESLRALVRMHQPHMIINAAAYTAVDRAETEPALAMAVNATAPGVLAQEAQALGAVLVHYSTDYVFDGAKVDSYIETDSTRPLSVYGLTKRAGELAILEACQRSLIIRTSWVFGSHGTNFLKTMLRLGAERSSLRVVADQLGAPTSAQLIAHTTAHLLTTMRDIDAADSRWGLYHLAALGVTSWHGYATAVLHSAKERGMRVLVRPEQILPIATHEYPLPAQRPANSRLDTSKIIDTFGVKLSDWRVGMESVLDDLQRDVHKAT